MQGILYSELKLLFKTLIIKLFFFSGKLLLVLFWEKNTHNFKPFPL